MRCFGDHRTHASLVRRPTREVFCQRSFEKWTRARELLLTVDWHSAYVCSSMNAVQIERKRNSVPECKNETIRRAAHKWLDMVLDEVDAVEGSFGTRGVIVGFANGQFSTVKTTGETNRKVF
jgi:hypothetical protein